MITEEFHDGLTLDLIFGDVLDVEWVIQDSLQFLLGLLENRQFVDGLEWLSLHLQGAIRDIYIFPLLPDIFELVLQVQWVLTTREAQEGTLLLSQRGSNIGPRQLELLSQVSFLLQLVSFLTTEYVIYIYWTSIRHDLQPTWLPLEAPLLASLPQSSSAYESPLRVGHSTVCGGRPLFMMNHLYNTFLNRLGVPLNSNLIPLCTMYWSTVMRFCAS
jgi:hypothetical protein